MNATHTPIGDRMAQHSYSESELLRTTSSFRDDAISFEAIVGRSEPLIGANPEAADALGLLQRMFAHLDERERPLVRMVMRSSQHPIAYAFGSALNWLGNGWLYLFAGVALLAWQGTGGIRPTLAAGISVGIAFLFYMSVKPILARPRPRDADPLARLPIEPMDKYSCPSGHCMTVAAVAVPLLLSFPQLQPLILSLCVLIAWSRIACGHHYPSDVLLGVGLGIAVAMPVCNLIL
jgi:undecaprenyl-diphosphatase